MLGVSSGHIFYSGMMGESPLSTLPAWESILSLTKVSRICQGRLRPRAQKQNLLMQDSGSLDWAELEPCTAWKGGRIQ